MADQIVITEKSSQAKDVRAAVGSRYGDILPAEGHLLDLLEPEDVVPDWKRWSPILLRPEGLYGTRPAEGGNKAAKLNSSARKFSNITITAATSCAYCSPRRIRRQSATHSVGQSQMPNMPAFTPPPLRADRPTRSTICHSPAPPPSSWVKVRGE